MNISCWAAFGLTVAGAGLPVEVLVGRANEGLAADTTAVWVIKPCLGCVFAITGLRGTLALAGVLVVEGDA